MHQNIDEENIELETFKIPVITDFESLVKQLDRDELFCEVDSHKFVGLKLPKGIILPVFLIQGNGIVLIQTVSFAMWNGATIVEPHAIAASKYFEKGMPPRVFFVHPMLEKIIIQEARPEDESLKLFCHHEHIFYMDGRTETIDIKPPREMIGKQDASR